MGRSVCQYGVRTPHLRSVHDLERECHPDLTILVGELDEKSHFATFKSHNKYALVSEKNALLTVIERREKFTEQLHS
jgi:hypothetical protein